MSLNFLNPITINGATQDSSSLNFFTENSFYLNGSYSPQYQDVTVSGNNELNLVNAKANGLNYLKAFGVCEQKGVLPSEYTQLEYISTGNTAGAYIELNLQPNANSIIETRISTTATVGQFVVATGTTPQSGVNFRIVKFTASQKVGGSIGKTNYESTYDGSTPVIIRIDHKKVYANGELIGDGSDVEISTYTNINLFRGQYSTMNYSLGTMYYTFISVDGINPDFFGIPALRNSDNIAGLYDIVNNTFYPSGDEQKPFVAGPVVNYPSPHIPYPIVCNNGELKSPNLFDVSTMSTIQEVSLASTYGADNIFYAGSGSNSVVIPCIENTNYILSLGGEFKGTVFRVATTERLLTNKDNSSNPYKACAINRTPVNDTLTINSGLGAKYMYIQFSVANISSMLSILQVQTGTTTTPYTRYKQIYVEGTTETIKDSLNNTATCQNLFSIDDIADTQEILTGAIAKRTGVLVFDGTESWVSSNGAFNLSDVATNVLYGSTYSCLCTHYAGGLPNQSVAAMPDLSCKVGANSASIRNRLYIKDTRFAGTGAFKEFLANEFAKGTPVIMVYPKDTSEPETTTPQRLTTQKGANKIEITQASIDPLKLEAQYKAGIEVTITEVQNANLDNSVVVTIGE